MEFRKLKPEEIDVKVGSVSKKGYTLLLYKNARVDMEILDETVGAENWQRDHKECKGNLYCGIGINNPIIETENGKPVIIDRWVWKWDCGTESAFGDKEKGEASDSFKRAGFNWGIGRELYTSPMIFIFCETKYNETKRCYEIADEEKAKSNNFYVGDIKYKDNKIVNVTLYNHKTKADDWFFGEVLEKPEPVGGDYLFTSGKYNGKTIKEVSQEDNSYLDYLLNSEKVSEKIKENIKLWRTVNGLGNGDIQIK